MKKCLPLFIRKIQLKIMKYKCTQVNFILEYIEIKSNTSIYSNIKNYQCWWLERNPFSILVLKLFGSSFVERFSERSKFKNKNAIQINDFTFWNLPPNKIIHTKVYTLTDGHCCSQYGNKPNFIFSQSTSLHIKFKIWRINEPLTFKKNCIVIFTGLFFYCQRQFPKHHHYPHIATLQENYYSVQIPPIICVLVRP